MSKELFYDELLKLNIALTEKQKKDLELFADKLLDYNKITNITAIKDKDGIYLKHFYDSLTLIKAVDLNKKLNVLDVGSGGGFPGIVLKIVYPNLNITLLDSNHKKTDFQNYIINELKLNNIKSVNNRAEEYIKESIKYDLVVARAVAPLNILSELCIPFVKIDGIFIAMKGNSSLELECSKKAFNILGGKFISNIEFTIPFENSFRSLIVIQKLKETPKEYPRSFDKISKKPIK